MNGPTIALYVRIPAALHGRLMAKVAEGESWKRRGGIQRLVIGALEAALPVASTSKKKKGGAK